LIPLKRRRRRVPPLPGGQRPARFLRRPSRRAQLRQSRAFFVHRRTPRLKRDPSLLRLLLLRVFIFGPVSSSSSSMCHGSIGSFKTFLLQNGRSRFCGVTKKRRRRLQGGFDRRLLLVLVVF
jgi:hypothetical protein